MKVLTVNWVYGENSTGKIIKDIENSLKGEDITFFHVYEFGSKAKEKNAYRLNGMISYKIYYRISRITGYQYEIGTIPCLKCISKIKKEKPDIVHLHCPNAGSINLFMLLEYLKKYKISTVITNHAEFYYTGSCAHAQECEKYLDGCGKCERAKEACNTLFFDHSAHTWRKMYNAFKNYEKIVMVAVSPWVENRIKTSVIANRIHTLTIYNGIDTKNIFYPRKETVDIEQFMETGKKSILHVTANFSLEEDNKGGRYIIELAKRFEDEGVQIIVIGPHQLKSEDIPFNMKLTGIITNQDLLAQFYSAADLTVITSKRETFGMVYAESICCGTPVVGFENGGTNSIAIEELSEFSPYGDIDILFAHAKKWLEKPEINQLIIEKARERFSHKKMAEKYYNLYTHLLKSDIFKGHKND